MSHLGVAKEIADVETEQSQEAVTCRRFYRDALKCVFRDFPWSFATRTQALALVAENPDAEWSYSYAYPTDCSRLNKIQSGTSFDNRSTRVNYRLENNGSQLLIYTNQQNAVAEFVQYTENIDLYPPDFKMAFSFFLAALTAPRLTKGDPFKMKSEMMAMYYQWLSEAKANGLNEEQWPSEPPSDLIRGRE